MKKNNWNYLSKVKEGSTLIEDSTGIYYTVLDFGSEKVLIKTIYPKFQLRTITLRQLLNGFILKEKENENEKNGGIKEGVMTHLEILEMFYKDKPFYEELKDLFNLRYDYYASLRKYKRTNNLFDYSVMENKIKVLNDLIDLKLKKYGVLHAFIGG